MAAQQPIQQPMIKQASRKLGCARPDRDKSSEPCSPPVPVFSLKSRRAQTSNSRNLVQHSQQGAGDQLGFSKDHMPRSQASLIASSPAFYSGGRRPVQASISSLLTLPGICSVRWVLGPCLSQAVVLGKEGKRRTTGQSGRHFHHEHIKTFSHVYHVCKDSIDLCICLYAMHKHKCTCTCMYIQSMQISHMKICTQIYVHRFMHAQCTQLYIHIYRCTCVNVCITCEHTYVNTRAYIYIHITLVCICTCIHKYMGTS